MKKSFLIAMLLFLVSLPAWCLELGDPAPAISPAKWITGEAADPTAVDDATFYLVEVWSVTCPPCVKTIPILNDLQARYAEKGLKIISFTTDTEQEVVNFLNDHPMEYSSFLDKEGETMVKYMAADNRNTIPHAFLFDKTGTLVWIGNPLDNLEFRVNQVLDGKLNRDKALAVRDARKGLQSAFESQNVEGMMASLKQLESLEPENGQYYQVHYRILTELGAGEEQDVRDLMNAWYKGCYDQPEDMVILSLVAIDQGHPNVRNPSLALAAAKRAYAIDDTTKVQAGLNLAEIYKNISRIDLAMAVLDEVVGLADADDAATINAIKAFYGRVQELSKNPDAEYQP